MTFTGKRDWIVKYQKADGFYRPNSLGIIYKLFILNRKTQTAYISHTSIFGLASQLSFILSENVQHFNTSFLLNCQNYILNNFLPLFLIHKRSIH